MGPDDFKTSKYTFSASDGSTLYWDVSHLSSELDEFKLWNACERILAVVKSTHWGLHHYGD